MPVRTTQNARKEYGYILEHKALSISISTRILEASQPGFLRQLTTWHCPHLLLCAMLRVCCCSRAHSSKPAAAACGRRMWRKDRRTSNRCIDPAPRTMQAVPTLWISKCDQGWVCYKSELPQMDPRDASTHVHSGSVLLNRKEYAQCDKLTTVIGRTDFQLRWQHLRRSACRGNSA